MSISPSDSLRSAIAERIAAGWIALGGQLVGAPDGTTLDLEALIAATAQVEDGAVRVREVALDWCIGHGRIVNGSRLRSVAAEIGSDQARLGNFAATVAASGGPRWPMATDGPTYATRRKVVVSDLAGPSRLNWRLRAAFGVNARADILVALGPTPGNALSIADLARRTRFTKRNISVAVASMALAGVVEVDRRGNEDRVRLSAGFPLLPWLDVPPAAVIDWTSRWHVALRVLDVATATASASPAVRAVEVRAAALGQLDRLSDAGLPRPDLTVAGPAVAKAMDAWICGLAAVMLDVSR